MLREKIFFDYLKPFFNVGDGDKYPWYLFIIRIMLFPVRFFQSKFNNYDFLRDIYLIEGMKISGNYFRTLKTTTPSNEAFQVVSNNMGIVTVKRIYLNNEDNEK